LAKSFLQSVQERVVVYDGAMGTNIQFRNPSVDDFWGKEGCNELLVLSRPDIISDIHAAFYKVGCDVVETNTFGSTRIVLAEYQLEDKVAELNIVAAQLAKMPGPAPTTPDSRDRTIREVLRKLEKEIERQDGRSRRFRPS